MQKPNQEEMKKTIGLRLQKGWLRYIITLCGRNSVAILYWITVPYCRYVRNIIEERKVKSVFLDLSSFAARYNRMSCDVLPSSGKTFHWKLKTLPLLELTRPIQQYFAFCVRTTFFNRGIVRLTDI